MKTSGLTSKLGGEVENPRGAEMKITQGFVAATADGQFLRTSVRQTHTGTHVSVNVVPDIDQADVYLAPRFWDRDTYKVAPDHTWLPVEVRREVILKGYGI